MDSKTSKRLDLYPILLVIGIVFVAFNLRPAITSVGPIIGVIRDDIGFANWNVAFIMSLPLIAFAILSPITPIVANRLSNEMTLVIGLTMLFIGISMRSISMIFFLFIGTLLVGLGIAICNVLLPSIIKDKFPLKVALMTGVYSTSMGVFATIASAVSFPLAIEMNLGWQLSLFVWVIPVVIALIIWLLIYRLVRKHKNNGVKFIEPRSSGVWKSKLAWKVATFMGLQSLVFYVTISWLPEILISFGMSKSNAGFMLSYFQFVGLPASFIIPVVAGKLKSQANLIVIINIGYIIGIVLLLSTHSFVMTVLAVTFIGISSGSNFALALTLLSFRAKDKMQAAELSGMAQSVGYSLAAIGPVLIGYLFDLTHTWVIPLTLLIGMAILIIYFGFYAGQNKYVLD